MNIEEKFNQEMLNLYQVVGKATGYWANYYLRFVRQHGGLAYAKKALGKKDDAQDGFKKLIEVGRPDLSVEATVLKDEYRSLFTADEIKEAQRRIDTVPNYAWRKPIKPNMNFSGEIEEDELFTEGSIKRVTVNLYERNPAARKKCIDKYGYNCKVCGMSFEKTYGKIGQGFIHIHHIKPLAGIAGEYELNPIKDLVPVCPNSHAMLHTFEPPLSVEELKKILDKNKG
jgi:5-methylcytosine-specific restriction protein A